MGRDRPGLVNASSWSRTGLEMLMLLKVVQDFNSIMPRLRQTVQLFNACAYKLQNLQHFGVDKHKYNNYSLRTRQFYGIFVLLRNVLHIT